jgi:hypothetical protein
VSAAIARGLSIHARYACQDSGACCASGWEIPVERELDRQLRAAAAAGRLAWPSTVQLLVERPGLPDEFVSVLGRSRDGACVLHDKAAHRCRAHAQLGAGAKPISCRQFPRILVHDPRGTSVTLSHFCPTAASLLFDGGPVCAVPITERATLEPEEGLDVRLALPPALDEDRLVDWDTLTVWEELVLDVCNRGATPGLAIGVLHTARTHLQAWTPRRGPMKDWLSRYEWRGVEPPPTPSATGQEWEELVRTAIPPALRPEAQPEPDDTLWNSVGKPHWLAASGPLRRYVAARAFACWPLHVGHGLATQLRYLQAALALVEREAAREVTRRGVALDAVMLTHAIRQADLRLVHLADPRQLAESLDREAH